LNIKNIKQIICVFPIIITLLAINSFCKDSLIVVPDGYASGEIAVEDGSDMRWYNDTITFSCGVKITFYDLNAYILYVVDRPGIRGIWLGGLVVIGNDTETGFRYHDSLKRGHIYSRYLDHDRYICTYNNPDSIWNFAHSYPDSLSPIDTFHDKSVTINAMCLFEEDVYCVNINPHLYEYHTNTYNYKPILYLLTGSNRKMKIQVSRLKTVNGELDSIYLNWAVDSCGNGKFMQTSAVTANYYPDKTPLISICKTSSEYILKLENIRPGKERYSITLYDIKGRKIFFQNIKSDNKIKIRM
jgi:hypothetical protein